MVNPKNKGATAERELCKKFTDIFGNKFIRSPGSGAYVGGKNRFRKQELGEGTVRTFVADIVPPEDMPKMVVESKHYADLPLHNVVKPVGVKLLDSWLEDLKKDCGEQELGILCFKLNNKGWYLAFPSNLKSNFAFGNYIEYNGYTIVDFDTFFINENNVDKFKDLCR